MVSYVESVIPQRFFTSEAKSYYRAFADENEVMKGEIAALNFLYPLLRETEDYTRISNEILEDDQDTGVRYVEFFWDPTDTTLPYADVTQTLADVFDQAEIKWAFNRI